MHMQDQKHKNAKIQSFVAQWINYFRNRLNELSLTQLNGCYMMISYVESIKVNHKEIDTKVDWQKLLSLLEY